MGVRLKLASLTCLVAIFGGCRSQQLACDQDHIRAAVLDLQTNQIVDNLVRIRRGLPILQLDYQHMTGTVNQSLNASVSGSQTDANTGNRAFITTLVPGFAAFSRVLTNVVNYNTAAGQTNQLTLTAEPLTNDVEVYNQYLEFMGDESRLVESPEAPPPEAAVVVRCYHEPVCPQPSLCFWQPKTRTVYYWVPVEHRAAFFKLALHAVALRGTAVTASPYYTATITDYLTGFREVVGGEQSYEVWVKIDQQIPRDTGYMLASIKGHLFQGINIFKTWTRTPRPGSEAAAANLGGGSELASHSDRPRIDAQKTDEVLVTFSLNTLNNDAKGFNITLDDVRKDLLKQKVRIRLENSMPGGSPTDNLLEDIRHQLELQRLNQFQLMQSQ